MHIKSCDPCCFEEMMTSTLFILSVLMNVQYCASDKIQKIEMGRACGVYGGGERRVQGFGGET